MSIVALLLVDFRRHSRATVGLSPGDTVGPYMIEETAGSGGMGVVFRAVRESDGQPVALKMLKADLSDDPIYRQRFVHEVRAASSVEHPNLVKLVDSGKARSSEYLVYEWVPGTNLQDRLASEQRALPVADVAAIVDQVAAGLQALHEHGIVHRDVKASNVILREDGVAVLVDLGLAKSPQDTMLTRPGQVMGTLEYVAPELIQGSSATRDSDVYALGCLAFELTTGSTPFAGRGIFQVGLAHLEEDPPEPQRLRPDCTHAFGRALLLALAKNPGHRPQSPEAYARALRGALGGV